jgi:hypothetical protein
VVGSRMEILAKWTADLRVKLGRLGRPISTARSTINVGNFLNTEKAAGIFALRQPGKIASF